MNRFEFILFYGVTIDNHKQSYFVPYSGAVKVNFKAKKLPYVIYIDNVSSGTMFNIDDEYYVVGDKGETSIDTECEINIQLNKKESCKLILTEIQKKYDCKNPNDNKNLK